MLIHPVVPRASIWIAVATIVFSFGRATPQGQDAAAPQVGSLRGKLTLDLEGVRLADVGPIVIVLDGVDAPLKFDVPKEQARVRQKDARFVPSFLVVTAGQTLELSNDDRIFHNVFSYSKPNEFDLGTYSKGSSRFVTLRHPGLVHVYCSIHASMNAAIFVAPSPYFDLVSAMGKFDVQRIPPGNYLLRTWCAKLPELTRNVEIIADGATTVELTLRPDAPMPADSPALR
jgi:plastocyanin